MNTKKIDFHTHYLPQSYKEALKRHIPGNPDGWPTPDTWTVDTTLDFMQQNGIDYSVLSLSSPHINFGSRKETLELASDANLQGYKLSQQYPEKLGFLATLPIPYEADAIKEYQIATSKYSALGVTVPLIVEVSILERPY